MKLNKMSKIVFYIIAIIWAIMTLYPLFFTLISSLKTNNEIYTSMFSLPKEYHFEYYMKALIKGNIAISVRNSFFIALVSTGILSVIASSASYVMTRMHLKVNGVLNMFFMFGVMIPVHSTLIPLVKLVSKLNGQNNFGVMIAIYIAFNLSMSIFIIASYMKGISKEIDEAGIIDGCSPLQLFTRIIFPLSKPAIATAGIISFLFIYNELLFSVMFLTDKDKQTVSVGLMSFVGQRSQEIGPTYASIILTIIPMVIIYLLFQEKVESGMTAGSVKG